MPTGEQLRQLSEEYPNAKVTGDGQWAVLHTTGKPGLLKDTVVLIELFEYQNTALGGRGYVDEDGVSELDKRGADGGIRGPNKSGLKRMAKVKESKNK
jgi:hypothetical protein